MANLDDSWRPDRCEILITAAGKNIPAGYPREGLNFELVGSLERIDWPPFVQAVSGLIANSIPVVSRQIIGIGGDVYLHTLIDLDSQTRQWIAKVLAGAA